MTVSVRPIVPADAEFVRRLAIEHWGSEIVVAHGVAYEPATLPGFVAEEGDRAVGFLTYHVHGDACEVVTIDAFRVRSGIGTALMDAVRALGHERVWLITTNDNVDAQRFYEHGGFRLAAVHEGAVVRSRELKPEIPLLGRNGVPIRDELEYEYRRA
jgi:ribosomal protein S18 acetylase RimI-like enzyme